VIRVLLRKSAYWHRILPRVRNKKALTFVGKGLARGGNIAFSRWPDFSSEACFISVQFIS
jgi:hypothetical protein